MSDIYISVIYAVASAQCNSSTIEGFVTMVPIYNKNFWKPAKIDYGDKFSFSMLIFIHRLFPVPFHYFSSASMT